MIKIIYGVKDKSSVCELIFPAQDNIGISNFVDQSIIKSDYDEQIVKSFFYSIRCVGNFYVFSKIKLVYDSQKRVSYRAYIISFEKHEPIYNVLDKINNLEKQYDDGEAIQPNAYAESIENYNSSTKKQTVAVYYNSEKELENYFEIEKNYTQYERIYFIDKKYMGQSENPINALRNCGQVVQIGTLISNYYSNEYNTNKEKRSIQLIISQIHKSRIVIFFFGVLFGIIGLWGYQKLFFEENNPERPYIENAQILDSSNTTINTQVVDTGINHKDSVRDLSKQPAVPQIGCSNSGSKQGNGNEGETVSSLITNGQLSGDMQGFLQKNCKTMTIDSIILKINSFTNWQKIKNLIGFANFILLIKKNPPTKTDITKFISDNESNFNEQDEYVKFVRYLSTKNDDFFNQSKTINSISKKTLKIIEAKYGYN